MHEFDFRHVRDEILVRDLTVHSGEENAKSATVIAEIAEVDARKLYVPAGYPSMYAYCLHVLRFSEDAAYKRIQAARAGRQFPLLFGEIATGRLHLAAVCLLAPHLTPDNADELVAAAVNRTKSEIEEFLAKRFPGSRESSRSHSTIRPVVAALPHAGFVEGDLLRGAEIAAGDSAPPEGPGVPASPEGPDMGAPAQLAPGQVGDGSEIVERFEVRVTIDKLAYERLRHLQALMSHAIPDGDLALVLSRAVETTIAVMERRKLGASRHRGDRVHVSEGRKVPNARSRYIPAHVRRAVWNRDAGQCTFVGAGGHRCQARHHLEFDHVEPMARGGESTVEGLRLRCSAHNQYEAERAFGSDFMKTKREAARSRAAEAARSRAAEAARSRASVIAALRNLGCRSDEARRAAEYAESLPIATLEDHLRAALTYLRPRTVREGSAPYASTCPGAS